jgi:hypothetical protein
LEEYGPCPIFAGFTLAFALQLREKSMEKTSVRVGKTSVRGSKTVSRLLLVTDYFQLKIQLA